MFIAGQNAFAILYVTQVYADNFRWLGAVYHLFSEVFFMVYVGIDVAKTTHYAAAADSDGVVLIEPFAFDNDASGFTKLISKIASFPKEQLIIGLDPTVCQSGKFKARYAKMSKRGSEMLRFALINSAWQLTLRNVPFLIITA